MKKQSVVLCSLLAAAVSAHAESGFYVAGSIGQSQFRDSSSKSDLDDILRSEGFGLSSSSLDKKDTGYKLQVGYQFNDNFAIEGGYVDLGKMTYKANGSLSEPPISITGSTKIDAEATGINLDGVLALPIGNSFSFFAKLGIIDAKVKVKTKMKGIASDGISSAPVEESESESSTKVKAHIGLGLAYNFYKGLSVRAELERFSKLGDSDIGETDVDLFSLGLAYRF